MLDKLERLHKTQQLPFMKKHYDFKKQELFKNPYAEKLNWQKRLIVFIDRIVRGKKTRRKVVIKGARIRKVDGEYQVFEVETGNILYRDTDESKCFHFFANNNEYAYFPETPKHFIGGAGCRFVDVPNE